MYRPPKRWIGKGGAYDIESIRKNRSLYVLGTGFTSSTTGLDPSQYRLLGTFHLFFQPFAQVITPRANTLVYFTQSDTNTWPTLLQLSFVGPRILDAIDGATLGRTFTMRSRISDSSFTFKVVGDGSIRGSSTDTNNFDKRPSDLNDRPQIVVLSLFPTYISSVGIPKAGEEYDVFWVDPDAPSSANAAIAFEPEIVNTLSTIANYSTTIQNYSKQYSTIMDNVKYSSMISTNYITALATEHANMFVSTATYSTTYAIYSTCYASYLSSLCTYRDAVQTLSTLSTIQNISTPILEKSYAELSTQKEPVLKDDIASTIAYNINMSSLLAISTSLAIMDAVKTAFQTTSFLPSMYDQYPNLSSILSTMTGDPVFYMRGGAGQPIDNANLYPAEFRAQRISSLVENLYKEKAQIIALSTVSTIWDSTMQVETSLRSYLQTLKTSTSDMFTRYLSTNETANMYNFLYTSTLAQIEAGNLLIELDSKKITYAQTKWSTAQYIQQRDTLTNSITMANQILSLLTTTPDPYSLFLDQIPNLYSPAIGSANVPSAAWTMSASIEIMNPVNTWKTRDYSTLFAKYGIGVPIYFMYSNKRFYMIFNDAENQQIKNTTFKVDRTGWSNPIASDLPMSVPVVNTSYSTYTYTTLTIQVISAVLTLNNSYTSVLKRGDYSALLEKYGLLNWIEFTFGGTTKYRIRFLSASSATEHTIEFQKFTTSWGPVGTPDVQPTATISCLLEPFVPQILLADSVTIQKEYYYDKLNEKFGTSSIYFIASVSGIRNLYKLNFATTETATTRQITIQQYISGSGWGTVTSALPIGSPIPIQITVGTLSTDEILAQITTFEIQRNTVNANITSLDTTASALESEVGSLKGNLEPSLSTAWGIWTNSTILVEAAAFQALDGIKREVSSLYDQYTMSTMQILSDSYIEEKRLSTFNGLKNPYDSAMSTFSAKVTEFYRIESQLQEVIGNLTSLNSDIHMGQQRCSEIRSLWQVYLDQYTAMLPEYQKLSQRRMDISYSSGRLFVAAPDIPAILTLSSLNGSTCQYLNQISDISYFVQSGGAQITYYSTLSTITYVSTSYSTLYTSNTFQLSSITDAETLLRLKQITLEQFNQFCSLLDTTKIYNTDAEFGKYLNTMYEISSQVMHSISHWRTEEIVMPSNSSMTISSLYAMRGFRRQLDEFIDAIQNEYSIRSQVAQNVFDYSNQQYLWKSAKAGAIPPAELTSLITSIDTGVSLCNSYVVHRQNLFTPLVNQIQYISTMGYFDSESITNLYNQLTVSMEGSPSFVLEPRLPLQMKFEPLPRHKTYFMPGGVLQPPIPPCVIVSTAAGVPVMRPTPIDPTTTADLRNCGPAARYVEITNFPGGAFEGVQIIVIDKTGRNVALRRPVILSPTGLPAASAAALLTNGAAYSSEVASRLSLVNQVFSTGGLNTLSIDLGQEYSISAIRYMKSAGSTYDPSQLRATLKNAAGTGVANKAFQVNANPVILDFRPSPSSTCPISIQRTRYGTCGTMGAYIRLLPPNPFPQYFQFELAQIVVVNSVGQNAALGRPVTLVMNGTRSTVSSSLTAGVYQAQPAGSAVQVQVNSGAYLEIDLGGEVDIVAVHLHTQIGTVNAANIRVQLFTADLLQAGNDALVVGNRRQEIVDFRHIGLDSNCSVALRWPTYYGTAGILASGIRISRATGGLRFGAMKVIDRAGRNVVLFRNVEVNPGVQNPVKQAAVQEADGPQDISVPFVSAGTGPNQYAKVMFETAVEVCAIYVYSADAGLQVELLDEASAPVITFSIVSQQGTVMFDTRYNPDTSDFPTTETAPLVRYGQFGLFAQSVRIGPLPTPTRMSSMFTLTDSTGNTKPYTVAFLNFENMWKSADYDTLVAQYRFDATAQYFYFSYNTKFFRGKFLNDGNDMIRKMTLELYTAGAWAPIGSNDIPFNAYEPAPTFITIQVLLNPSAVTTGWLPSNIAITDGTGKQIMPLLVKSYTVSFLRFNNTWKEGDFAALIAAYPVGSWWTFMYKYKVFRGRFNDPENPYIKNTTLQIDRSGTGAWEDPLPTDLDVTPNEASPHVQIVIDVFLNGATAFSDGQTLTLNFNRSFEVNSVLLHATEFGGTPRTVSLIDCGGQRVAEAIAGGTAQTYMNQSWITADFRRRKFNDETSGPLIPYPILYGAHNTGVLARYIEIIPKDVNTPLYISQIIAVNACGRNAAYQKDTYTSNPGPNTLGPERAVDGIYQDELTPEFAQTIIYDAYKPKQEADSFKSGIGPGTRWIVDLGRFVQKPFTPGDKNSLCRNQVSNGACGITVGDQYTYNHEINCVIFIAPIGRAKETEGAIVRLIDANGTVVGVQRVTSIVNLFGVDFLDFRRDTSRNLMYDLVEEEKTTVEVNGCAVKIQYVRVEQIPGSSDPIQLSQIYVIDQNNRNVALYKPTTSYDSSGSLYDLSYRATDGIYYIKTAAEGYMSRAGTGKWIEVNLGCPTFVTKVWIVNLRTGDDDVDAYRMSRMRIKLFSGERDVVAPIAVQTLASSQASATNPPGVRTLTIAKAGDAKTIDSVGVDNKVRILTRKYKENLIPVQPATAGLPTSTAQYNALNFTATCNQDLAINISSPYTLGPNRGVMAHYIRILNPLSYIQISQLLIFDGAGNGISRTIPPRNVFATSALPERFPERAIDGNGGFFHVNRPDNMCYISEKKRYDYWQVQVADLASAGLEISAIKYFPPKFNRVRNIGLRFQLLDAAQTILSQYVLKESDHAANEFWVDFRVRGPSPLPPIIQYCFPRIETVGAATFTRPIGVSEEDRGSLLVSDQDAGAIYSIPYTASNDTFGTPTVVYTIANPVGLEFEIFNSTEKFIFIAQNGPNVATAKYGTPVYTANSTTLTPWGGLVGPVFATVWDSVNGRLYTSYSNGVGDSVANFKFTGLNRPMGLVIRTLSDGRFLYVACRDDFCVRVFNLATQQEDVSKRIGILGQAPTAPVTVLSEHPTRILLGGPVGLALDDGNNLYISDAGTDTIYVTAPDSSLANRSLVYRLAGTGTAGFSENTAFPATQCMMNEPQCLVYHRASGDILVADMGNRSIRRIRIGSLTRRLIPLKPTVSPIYPTTTQQQGVPDPAVPSQVPIFQTQNRDRETIREYKAPARIEMLD